MKTPVKIIVPMLPFFLMFLLSNPVSAWAQNTPPATNPTYTPTPNVNPQDPNKHRLDKDKQMDPAQNSKPNNRTEPANPNGHNDPTHPYNNNNGSHDNQVTPHNRTNSMDDKTTPSSNPPKNNSTTRRKTSPPTPPSPPKN